MQHSSTTAEAAPDSEKLPVQQPPTAQNAGTQRDNRGLVWGLTLLGALAVAVALAAPWSRAGLWDPAEVRVADFARRAAIHVFGASDLSLSGSADQIPTVEEVGRGELPVLSLALGLRLFGGAVWALRLPLLLWAVLGCAALYVLCRRLADRETALVGVLVLVSSPLYFVQARTGLGDIATMACVAVAFSGLHLAWADAALSLRARALCFALALVACAGGFFSRGAWLGVAVPALGTAMCWAFLGMPRVAGWYFAAAAGLLGVCGLGLGIYAFTTASSTDYSYLLGSAVITVKKLPTHDAILAQLGHGFFPWSALLPAALGAVLSAQQRPAPRVALALGLVLVIFFAGFAHALLYPKTGVLPFAAPFALAGVCALGLRELDSKQLGSPVLAAITAALLVLLAEDFSNAPEKAFVAFGVDAPSFPAGLAVKAKHLYQGVAAAGVVFCGVLALERNRWVSVAFDWLMRRTRLTRCRWLGAALVAGGLLLSWGFYPVLAVQLSPAGVYDTYHKEAAGKEPLGVVGQAATQGSAFYARGPVKALDSVRAAIEWLDSPEERRWLILKQKDLAAANSAYRAAAQRGNLPIIDATSSEILLASNRLAPGQSNQNPLAKVVLEAEPKPANPLTHRFGSELEVLGWEVREGDRVVSSVRRGPTYEFLIYYKVQKRISTAWKTFIHIDGTEKNSNKRLNGDHDTTPDYPFKEWQPGDFIVDRHSFKVDSEFPRGNYEVFFGLFNGAQRFAVTAGAQKDNRVIAGTLRFD